MTYEKAVTQTSSKLYRLSTKGKQVLCNFCDLDITLFIREFSFLNHYQFDHEIQVPAIIRNLDKNPIIDIILNDKKSKNEEDCMKNFTVVVEKSTEQPGKLSSPSESSQNFNLSHAEMKIGSSEKLCCKICLKDFNKRSKAKLHYETAHTHKRDNLRKSFKCQFKLCHEAFENKEDRKMHQMASYF